MFALTALASLLLAGSPYRPLPAEKSVRTGQVCGRQKVAMTNPDEVPRKAIANLPFAMGRKFGSLDEYLSHLRCRAGPIGLPWWREVRPGVYEQVTTRTGANRERTTRAELMKRFGFTA